MELNEREQKLIKALEICTDPNTKGNCAGRQCPFAYEDKCVFTALEMLGEVLALIKKLTKENERLSKATEEAVQSFTRLETLYKLACKRAEATKADTVRKFAERLKQTFKEDGRANWYIRKVIDQIAKEMLEGEK